MNQLCQTSGKQMFILTKQTESQEKAIFKMVGKFCSVYSPLSHHTPEQWWSWTWPGGSQVSRSYCEPDGAEYTLFASYHIHLCDLCGGYLKDWLKSACFIWYRIQKGKGRKAQGSLQVHRCLGAWVEIYNKPSKAQRKSWGKTLKI